MDNTKGLIIVQKRSFVVLLSLTIVSFVVLNVIDVHLKTSVAPMGIVSFEFAGNINVAQRILDSWGSEGRIYAALSLGYDFLFLFLYSLTLFAGCVLCARSFRGKSALLYKAGLFLAWIQPVAGVLDAIENYGLIKVLFGSLSEYWLQIAKWSATIKFSIVGFGILFILICTIIVIGKKTIKL